MRWHVSRLPGPQVEGLFKITYTRKTKENKIINSDNTHRLPLDQTRKIKKEKKRHSKKIKEKELKDTKGIKKRNN